MPDKLTFVRLFHADWGKDPKKRWAANAEHDERGWTIRAIEPVGSSVTFLERLLDRRFGTTLVGFDFPIGVPMHYGSRTGLPDFPSLLAAMGSSGWESFASVADNASEIGTTRPFFPRSSQAGVKRASLLKGSCPRAWCNCGGVITTLSGWAGSVRLP